jgi:energy-coupling factor transport system ATP-binding protein
MDPEVVIFDEPTAGLDPAGSQRILSVIKKLKSMGKSLVVISHDMDLIAEVADRVALMRKGTIVCDGPPEDIFCSPVGQCGSDLNLPKPLSFAMKVPALASGPEWPPTTVDHLLERISKFRQCGSKIP